MHDLVIVLSLLGGALPWYVSKKRHSKGRSLHIRAVFWSLKAQWDKEGSDWTLSIPLFERTRSLLGGLLLHQAADQETLFEQDVSLQREITSEDQEKE